jgi:CTP-dependent riboflavin kinase
MTDEVKTEMPTEVKIDIPHKVLVDANAVRGTELDVNGIPKHISVSSGYVGSEIDSTNQNTFFREHINGTETGMGLYNSINAIKSLITAPGELFIMKDDGTVFSGINHGIVFVAIIGSILAITAIALGIPNTHVRFPPSMIFGFA